MQPLSVQKTLVERAFWGGPKRKGKSKAQHMITIDYTIGQHEIGHVAQKSVGSFAMNSYLIEWSTDIGVADMWQLF